MNLANARPIRIASIQLYDIYYNILYKNTDSYSSTCISGVTVCRSFYIRRHQSPTGRRFVVALRNGVGRRALLFQLKIARD